MLCIGIYTFLLVLGLLNYYTTRDSLYVYLRCDKAGVQISNSITWNIKNSTDLRVLVGDLPDDFLRTGLVCCRPPETEDARIAHVLQMQQQAGPVTPLSPSIAGRLSITVVQANLNKNYGFMKMDLYCRIYIGHSLFETPTAKSGGRSPCWNKTMHIYLSSGVDIIYLEVYDEVTMEIRHIVITCLSLSTRTLTEDDKVAWVAVTIPQPVFCGETVDQWYKLSGRMGEMMEGEMKVVLSLVPTGDLPRTHFTAGGVLPSMAGGMICQYRPVGHTNLPAPPSLTSQWRQTHQLPVQATQQEDMMQMKELFPDVEEGVIQSVLEANRGDKNSTINSLLSMN